LSNPLGQLCKAIIARHYFIFFTSRRAVKLPTPASTPTAEVATAKTTEAATTAAPAASTTAATMPTATTAWAKNYPTATASIISATTIVAAATPTFADDDHDYNKKDDENDDNRQWQVAFLPSILIDVLSIAKLDNGCGGLVEALIVLLLPKIWSNDALDDALGHGIGQESLCTIACLNPELAVADRKIRMPLFLPPLPMPQASARRKE
jgi:hypothetical protein